MYLIGTVRIMQHAKGSAAEMSTAREEKCRRMVQDQVFDCFLRCSPAIWSCKPAVTGLMMTLVQSIGQFCSWIAATSVGKHGLDLGEMI